MAPEGSKHVEIAGLEDKWQVTATFAVVLEGTFLPIQMLYQGKTDCCHPKYNPPPHPLPPQKYFFDVFHSPNYCQ